MSEYKSVRLEAALSNALNKRRAQATIRRLTTNPPNAVDFSSNDFLSLATSQDLRARYLQELRTEPALVNLGSGGSRLLDGNSTYAEQLERDIADFHNAPSGLLCNSGFDANVGLFSCLPQRGDIIIFDEFIHASVHDGLRLSRASKSACFAHNDVRALRSMLEAYIESDPMVLEGEVSVFVAVEGIYSMDGDVAPLKAIVETVKELLPCGNGHIIVDEAHSTGVLGPKGRGLVCELGLERDVAVRLHTFGKALACNGAILLCSPLIREYLINYARPMIYTTFMSYPAQAAIRASYSFLMEGRTEPLRQNLHALIRSFHRQLLDMQNSMHGALASRHLLQVPTICPETPIFALLSSKPRVLAAHCQESGFVVRAIMPPTVPSGHERIRVCLHAGNTPEQIDRLVGTIRTWLAKETQAPSSSNVWRARI